MQKGNATGRLRALLVAVSLATGSTLAQAQGPMWGWDMDDDYGMPHPGIGMMGGGQMMMGPGYGMPPMTGYGYGMGSASGGMGMDRIMSGLWGLNLTKEQRTKLRQINRELQEKYLDYGDKRMDIREELFDAYAEDKPDPAKTAAIYRRLFDLKQAMIEEQIATRNKIYDLLTEEQREQLNERSEYRGKHHPRMMR